MTVTVRVGVRIRVRVRVRVCGWRVAAPMVRRPCLLFLRLNNKCLQSNSYEVLGFKCSFLRVRVRARVGAFVPLPLAPIFVPVSPMTICPFHPKPPVPWM